MSKKDIIYTHDVPEDVTRIGKWVKVWNNKKEINWFKLPSKNIRLHGDHRQWTIVMFDKFATYPCNISYIKNGIKQWTTVADPSKMSLFENLSTMYLIDIDTFKVQIFLKYFPRWADHPYEICGFNL